MKPALKGTLRSSLYDLDVAASSFYAVPMVADSTPRMSWFKKYGALISFLTLLSSIGGLFLYSYFSDKPKTYLLIDNTLDIPLEITFGTQNLGTLAPKSYFKIEIVEAGNTRVIAKDKTGRAMDEGEFVISQTKHGMRCYVYNIAGKGKYGISTAQYRTSGAGLVDPQNYEPIGSDSKVFFFDTEDHPQVRDCEIDFAFPETVTTYGRGPKIEFIGLLCHIDGNNQPKCKGI